MYCRFLPSRREEARKLLAQVNPAGALCAGNLLLSGTQRPHTASLRKPWSGASHIHLFSLKCIEAIYSSVRFSSSVFKRAHLFIYLFLRQWIWIILNLKGIQVYSFEFVFQRLCIKNIISMATLRKSLGFCVLI